MNDDPGGGCCGCIVWCVAILFVLWVAQQVFA